MKDCEIYINNTIAPKRERGLWLTQPAVFARHNESTTLAIWCIADNTRFIIGSRGGCFVKRSAPKVFLFPIDPKIALSLQSREEISQFLGIRQNIGDERIVTLHKIPGLSGITPKGVNKAMWANCNAVAGQERKDVEQAISN